MDNRTLDQIRRNETKLIYDLMEVEKENSKLQERIDKAIEYIEWQEKNPQYDNVWRNWECKSLIEILKGEKI